MLWEGSCLLWLPSFPVLPLYVFQLQWERTMESTNTNLFLKPRPKAPLLPPFPDSSPQAPPALGHTCPRGRTTVLRNVSGSRAALCLRGVSAALIIPDPKEMFPPTNTCLYKGGTLPTGTKSAIP